MHFPGVSGIIRGMRTKTATSAPARPGLLNLSPLEQLKAGKLKRRLLQLFVGLSLFGVSMGFVIQAGLGVFPWDVLHYGLAQHLPLSIGTIIIITGLLVLLAWIPLRQAPGVGTIANAVWIGVATDVTLLFLAPAEGLPLQAVYMLGGIALNGVATAMYIGSQLGPGPRDGLMTGLSRITGRSIRLVRTALEVVVVAIGWSLGGVLGVGTILFALFIGPLTQFFLPYFTVRLPDAEASGRALLRAGGAGAATGSRRR